MAHIVWSFIIFFWEIYAQKKKIPNSGEHPGHQLRCSNAS